MAKIELSKETLEKIAGGTGMNQDELIEALKQMPTRELQDFVKKFDETFDVTAAALPLAGR